MQISYSDIQVMRRWTLLLVAVTIAGLLGLTVLLAPSGAWYIPAAALSGVMTVLLWVNEQDRQERFQSE